MNKFKTRFSKIRRIFPRHATSLDLMSCRVMFDLAGFPMFRRGLVIQIDDKRYEVLGSLGAGAFGKVFSVREVEGGKVYAMKVSSHMRRSCMEALREIEVLKRPDIVDCEDFVVLHEACLVQDHYYLFYEEYCATLYDFMVQSKRCSFARLRDFALQLIRGIQVLHRAGYVHADLKPENILIESPSTLKLKIGDLGGARQIGMPLESYLCTRYYRAPELHYLTCDANPCFDVWSLGCILFELAIGSPLIPALNGWQYTYHLNILFPGALPACAKGGKEYDLHFDEHDEPRTEDYYLERVPSAYDKTCYSLYQGATLDGVLGTYVVGNLIPSGQLEEERHVREELAKLLKAMICPIISQRVTLDAALEFEFFKMDL